MSEQQGKDAQAILGEIQRINQLFAEALADCGSEELTALVRLMAGSLGELRAAQSKEQQQESARLRQQQAEQVQAGDLEALRRFQGQQTAGIAEVLSALKVIRQSRERASE